MDFGLSAFAPAGWPFGPSYHLSPSLHFGGGGIRTHETFITFTRFPSVLHRPLGHSSKRVKEYLLARYATSGILVANNR